jgi:hypothetical protein
MARTGAPDVDWPALFRPDLREASGDKVAVQSSPFPRPAPPVGQGAGGGPQGSLPDLGPLGPICEKK